MIAAIASDDTLSPLQKEKQTILEHFRLLQACDNLSLLTCVSFDRSANLLHPLPLEDGTSREVQVTPVGSRIFRLTPWPFGEKEVTFVFPARHVTGRIFGSSAQLEEAFHTSPVDELTVKLIA